MDTPDPTVLAALRAALDADPRNAPLWLHYADLLESAGQDDAALDAMRSALRADPSHRRAGLRLVPMLRESGRLDEALIRAEDLLAQEDDASLRLELARIHAARGTMDEARERYREVLAADATLADPVLEAAIGPAGSDDASADEVDDGGVGETVGESVAGPEERDAESDAEATDEAARAEVAPEGTDPEDWVDQFDWGDLRITFDDVAGLEDVKRQIRLRIIAPFKQPEIYRAFGRQGGGGILLYGPPGCGKTFIARATAGECGARFVSVGIADVVDKYWGESEKLVRALFEDARRRAPTVLFFDEFDALGSNRGRGESQFWKTLVDQLLQEMDGIGGRNDDVLVFGATNVPWHVDSAFRRPGRFDRIFLVPPPDGAAREQILRQHVAKLPGHEAVAVPKLAKKTGLFSGADLKSLAERAAERALDRSLETGSVHDVTMDDFVRELGRMTGSTHEWLATARNYARYSNEGGQYDDLVDFLKRAKRW